MAGHSHWAGIKHKKAREDKKRGRVFSRCSKAITSAARRGGKDPETNLELQYAIEAAKAENMPKDTIERAILKGVGELAGESLEAVRYEGYGSGGAAVMVDALTDNRNRTTPMLRRIFDSHGGKLGTSGCVAWNFETKGMFVVDIGEREEDEIFDLVVEAGAEDFQAADGFYEVVCPVTEFKRVMDALKEGGLEPESAEITEVPTGYVDLSVDDGRKIVKMMEELEEDDDVTSVYSNFNLPDELVAELSGGE
jgi:YebC/PmpR family DNA-binding regulatory protein